MSLLIRLITSCSVLALGLPGLTNAQNASALDSAKRLIAEQANLDLRVADVRRGPDLTAHEIELTRIPTPDQRVHLWRGSVSTISHWPSYVVAIMENQVLALAGFSAPQLDRLAAWLTFDRASSRESLREKAALLVLAADRSSYPTFTGQPAVDTGAASAVRHWAGQQRAGWPTDSVELLPDGRMRITLTALSSKQWAGQGPIWAPMAYVFLFGSRGSLLLWSSHEGKSFAVR